MVARSDRPRWLAVGTSVKPLSWPEEQAGFGSLILRQRSERERDVLHLRFVEDLTQLQIAELVGLSHMHVSRVIRSAISRLQPAAEVESPQASEPVQCEVRLSENRPCHSLGARSAAATGSASAQGDWSDARVSHPPTTEATHARTARRSTRGPRI